MPAGGESLEFGQQAPVPENPCTPKKGNKREAPPPREKSARHVAPVDRLTGSSLAPVAHPRNKAGGAAASPVKTTQPAAVGSPPLPSDICAKLAENDLKKAAKTKGQKAKDRTKFRYQKSEAKKAAAASSPGEDAGIDVPVEEPVVVVQEQAPQVADPKGKGPADEADPKDKGRADEADPKGKSPKSPEEQRLPPKKKSKHAESIASEAAGGAPVARTLMMDTEEGEQPVAAVGAANVQEAIAHVESQTELIMRKNLEMQKETMTKVPHKVTWQRALDLLENIPAGNHRGYFGIGQATRLDMTHKDLIKTTYDGYMKMFHEDKLRQQHPRLQEEYHARAAAVTKLLTEAKQALFSAIEPDMNELQGLVAQVAQGSPPSQSPPSVEGAAGSGAAASADAGGAAAPADAAGAAVSADAAGAAAPADAAGAAVSADAVGAAASADAAGAAISADAAGGAPKFARKRETAKNVITGGFGLFAGGVAPPPAAVAAAAREPATTRDVEAEMDAMRAELLRKEALAGAAAGSAAGPSNSAGGEGRNLLGE